MLTAGEPSGRAVASCAAGPCSGVPGMPVDLVACDSPVNLREDEGAKVRSRSDGASIVEPWNLGRRELGANLGRREGRARSPAVAAVRDGGLAFLRPSPLLLRRNRRGVARVFVQERPDPVLRRLLAAGWHIPFEGGVGNLRR